MVDDTPDESSFYIIATMDFQENQNTMLINNFLNRMIIN